MIRTTNFIIDKSKINYSQLNDYRIIRYHIPDTFYNYAKYIDKAAYGKLENYYKELLDRPCFFYRYERTIYVLHKKNDNIQPLVFKLKRSKEGDDVLEFETTHSEITYNLIDFHILIKILLADFFYNQDKTHRICQHYFYISCKIDNDTEGNEAFATGIEMSIKERNNEFYINGKATAFCVERKNISDYQTRINPYFELITKSGVSYFRQIKSSKVISFQQEGTKKIWRKRKTSKQNPAHLEWHFDNADKQQNTRGYALFMFQENFVAYLNNLLGVDVAKPKMLEAQKFSPKDTGYKIDGISETGLPLRVLKKIYVYDNRVKDNGENLNKIPLENFVKLFNDELTEFTKNNKPQKLRIEFAPIDSIDDFSKEKPILVLQDVAGIEFNEEKKKEDEVINKAGFLTGKSFNDPKKELYGKYANKVALQSVNVNTNSPMNNYGDSRYTDENYRDYFQYELFELQKQVEKSGEMKTEKTQFFHKLNVCLNELLLKYYIINQLPICGDLEISFPLPVVGKAHNLIKYAYQYKGVFLYINEEKQLIFIDLDTSVGKKERDRVLKAMGIDWLNIQVEFYEKHYLMKEDAEKRKSKLEQAKFIFTNGVVIEIQEPNKNNLIERVLLPYRDEPIKIRAGYRGTEKTDFGITGVWYNSETNHYVAGRPSKNTYKFGAMDKAHIVRKFRVYKGEDKFRIEDVLETISVQFVRNKQYTVYPYFFDLINLYRDMNDY